MKIASLAMKIGILLLLIWPVGLWAQALAQNSPSSAAIPPDSAQFQQVLSQIEQAGQQINLDVARLRIEKWKTGSEHKQQAQADADSLSKNLSAALPGMIDGARNAPAALAPSMKLYRDLNAVYDVLAGLTDEAASFAPKEEFQALGADQQTLDSSRQALGNYLETLASYKDSQVANLQTHAKGAAPPKKIIVDEEEPVRPVRKKKKAATSTKVQPAAKPAANQSQPANPQ